MVESAGKETQRPIYAPSEIEMGKLGHVGSPGINDECI